MAIELHGENFQSWENFDLTAEDGNLTVVVGPSNVGKSAMTRAIKGLLRNALSANQIRVGSSGLKIDAKIDGHTIVVERTKKGSATYAIDGKDYSKLDRKVPQEITDLGMGVIEIGDQKLDAVFAGQFDTQFILDRTDPQLNAILGAFSSTEQLEFGKRTANGRITDKNSEAKILAKEKQQVAERTVKLETLQVSADEIQGKIDALEPEIARGQGIAVVLESLIAQREHLDSLRMVIAAVTVPDTAPVAHSIQLVQATGRLADSQSAHYRIRLTLKSLVVPATAPVERGIQVTQASRFLIETSATLQRIETTLKRLVVPDAEPAITAYKVALYARQAAEAESQRTKARLGLDGIASVVTTWTEIVRQVQRGKALGEAEAAIVAQESSQARVVLTKLDARTANIEGLVIEVKRSGAGIKALEGLLEAKKSLDELRTKSTPLATEMKQADALLEKVTADHQRHQQALAAAAARKAAEEELARTTRICSKCGEPVKI